MKQNIKNWVKKDRQPVIAPKEESDVNQNIADVINDWISESRKNRCAEKAFSDERISAWKIIPSANRT